MQARRFYGEPSRVGPTRSFEDFQSNPMQTQWEYDFDTETVVMHLQDTWSLGETLRLNFGFRSVNVENTAATIVGDVKTGTIEADEPFLPQVGLNWELSDTFELFASAAENVRAFASSGTSGPFSTSAAGFAGDPRRRRAGAGDELRGRFAFPRRVARRFGRGLPRRLRKPLARHHAGPGHRRQPRRARQRRQREDGRRRRPRSTGGR